MYWPEDEVRAKLMPRSARTPEQPLTSLEIVVLTAVARGLTSIEAAAERGAAPLTEKEMRKRVYRALGARNAAHAVAIGIGRGLIEPMP